MPIGIPLGGKLIWTSNISSLMKVRPETLFLNVGRVDVFGTSMSLEPGDHNLLNLLLCSSKVSDKQYLSLLVRG